MAFFSRFRTTDPAPRFRSGDRDGHADQARLHGIRAAIRLSIASLDREQQGLKRRLDDAGATAASIAGTEGCDHRQRDPADEKLLAEAERQMMAAARRLGALRAQRAVFETMLDLVGSDGEAMEAVEARVSGIRKT